MLETYQQGCIWRGSGEFDPLQEVVDPKKVLQNLFGVDSNPPNNLPPIPFSC